MIIANMNKWIFSRYTFRYPAILTLLHMISCYALSRITLSRRENYRLRALSPHTSLAVLQLSLVFVASVAAGNAALKYIHISFAQAFGATAPLWTVVLSVMITRKSYTPGVYASLGVIFVGMVLTTTGEVNFDSFGFVLVLIATVTRALKSVMQGLLLSSPEERLDAIELLYHMSKRSVVWLGLWAVICEREAFFDRTVMDLGMWACILLTALVAFFLNVVNFHLTKVTSPVTLQVIGNLKNVLVILVSLAIFGNQVSLQAGMGCSICICGVVLYNRFR